MRVGQSLPQGLTPVILIALVVAIGAWAMRLSVLRKTQAEQRREQQAIATIKVGKGDFEVVVEAVGALEAVSSKPVVAQVSGQLVFLVPNGVPVKEGDIIAELDVPRMARRLRDQELQCQNAQDDLDAEKRELAAGVERAEIDLKKAQEELERFRAEQEADLTDKRAQRDHDANQLELSRERFERKRNLAQEGLVSQQEVELGTAEIKTEEFNVERQTKELENAEARKSSEELDKKAAVDKAQSDLERAKSAEEDETQNATMRLQIQEQQLDRLRDQLDKAIIRAPAGGIVVLSEERDGMSRRPLQPGDRVWEHRSVGSIPDLDKMRAVLEVPQAKARLIKRKQPALLRVEALPGFEFEGEVTEVAQTASEESFRGTGMPTGEKTFRTYVEIKDTKDAPLRPGMTVNVRIIIEKVPEAITVPLECIFDKDDRKVVYVKRGSHFEEVEVELDQENVDAVVVTNGLKYGEEVALRDMGAREETSSGGAEDSLSALPF